MESFLICTNPKCRYLVNLRDGAQVLERSKLILDECPECGSQWSSHCPFCDKPLEVMLHENLPHCSHCGCSLQAEAS
jgi:ribosomal protein L37AE/L43A